jgi:hypothetical protein
MRALIFVILSLISSITFAQVTVSWLGGAPGNENNWNDARNWSNHHVPDEDTHVIVKYTNSGHHAQPIIKTTVSVASISVYPNATLTVEKTGELLIDGTYHTTEGIALYHGELINKGFISLANLDLVVNAGYVEDIQNMGRIVVDNVDFFNDSSDGQLGLILNRKEAKYQ